MGSAVPLRITRDAVQNSAGIAVRQHLNPRVSIAQLLGALSDRQSELCLIPHHRQCRITVAVVGCHDIGRDSGHSFNQLLNAFDPALPLLIQDTS